MSGKIKNPGNNNLSQRKYFITGIGTEIGKTIVSSILVKVLEADYWKPVQAGDLHRTDSMKVGEYSDIPKNKIHPETYRLNYPMSPHAAAKKDGVQIDPAAFKLPVTNNHLIVEGAGGVMVPLTPTFMMIDLIKQLAIPTIIVSKNYLGSINHTLLTIAALKQRNIQVAGIVFNGTENIETENVICNYSKCKCLFRISELKKITREIISEMAIKVRPAFLANQIR